MDESIVWRVLLLTNLTIAGIYEEGDFANPTLLFHPVMVTDSVLSDEQKLTLMQKDHAYLGLAVDRNQLPTTSTRDATNWLSNLKDDLENVKGDLTLIDPTTNESFVVEDATLPDCIQLGLVQETSQNPNYLKPLRVNWN